MSVFRWRREAFGGILGARLREAEKALKPQRAEEPLKPRRAPAPLDPLEVGLRTLGKKAAENLARHFADAEHPFEACMSELAEQYPDEETRKQVCGAVVRELREAGQYPRKEQKSAEPAAGYARALLAAAESIRRGL